MRAHNANCGKHGEVRRLQHRQEQCDSLPGGFHLARWIGFNEPLNRSLGCPFPMFIANRLALALQVVAAATGEARGHTLKEHCRGRQAHGGAIFDVDDQVKHGRGRNEKTGVD